MVLGKIMYYQTNGYEQIIKIDQQKIAHNVLGSCQIQIAYDYYPYSIRI